MALDDGGAQIDPATLPENVELIQEIEALAGGQGAPGLQAPAAGAMRELVVEALRVTVEGLAAALGHRDATHPLEEDLRGGLAAALGRSKAAVFTEAKLRLPGWTPNLGGFDVVAVGSDGSVVLIETKWGSVWQALWDVLKLASAQQHPRVTAAYAVYAASTNEWAKQAGAEFFGDWDRRGFTTAEVLDDNAGDWNANLKGSPTVWPNEVPGAVDLDAVAVESVTLLERPYEIRAVSVGTSPAPVVRLDRGRASK
jgi:hypothetical protein